MDKEETIQFEDAVLDALPDGRFRVRLDNGHEVLAYTAGR
jgi:translation initiation factor IF-1